MGFVFEQREFGPPFTCKVKYGMGHGVSEGHQLH